MLRPAGDSSDDDEYKDYLSDNDDDTSVTNRALEHRQPTQEDIQQQTINKLFDAILKGYVDTVASILDDGFDVSSVLKDNWTPLLLAASIGNPELTKELITRHADVNTNKDFYTALMATCACPSYTSPYDKSLDVAKLLISNGADVNAKTRKRMTALMYAASTGNAQIVALLLPICDKTAEDNQGWTALFWAVNDNNSDVLKLLLKAELEVEKFDVRGNAPFHYARMNDFEEIINMLPCREKIKRSSVIPNSIYNIDELFESERPKFKRDVAVMLYGMKSDRYSQLMLNNNMDLSTFLNLTDGDLLNMGIKAPYQRYRILSGLYKFHKRMYKVKSVPIVSRDTPYTTYDVLNSMTVACRQLIVMEASLKYLLHNVDRIEQLKEFTKEIEQIKAKLENVKNTALAISLRAKEWDLENQPADLITSHSYEKLRNSAFNKCCTIGIISVLTLVVIRKLYF